MTQVYAPLLAVTAVGTIPAGIGMVRPSPAYTSALGERESVMEILALKGGACRVATG